MSLIPFPLNSFYSLGLCCYFVFSVQSGPFNLKRHVHAHKINNVGSFLNDSLCLKLHFMPRWWCSLYISSLNRLHLIWHFFSYLHFVLSALGRRYYSSRCVLIYSLTSWFAPLFSHSLHCVELFFLCAATLPVWFLICVAKQWLPGKSLSYISHWFP